ncbi:inter-alpha-trypsin inhibitor heavy chain H6 [Scyliorhinus torazame]|uniref:inter-alpha-trypsin inhibitor heavy chain H6 n=1 Tax=Scyliorhinus torazame TaxID=75743 RepID=UPI003B5A2AF6
MQGLADLSTALALCVSILMGYSEASGHERPARSVEITDFLIQSTVVSRYALTSVHSEVHNPGAESREAIFDIDLPQSAFISNFSLTIDGNIYPAQVKEKEKAQKIYDVARAGGRTAAHVATRGREADRFRVAVNVGPGGRVGFSLSYEELLPRRLGRYELALSVRPRQVVRNLTVEVVVAERTGIERVEVLPLRTSKLLSNKLKGTQDVPDSTTIERSANCARICFTPSAEQQAQFSSQGIQGDFVVQYDVNMADLVGDIQTYNGYFVHYFAPRDLPVVSKNVIFIIDVSSSMIGAKIRQTKEGMSTILSDLRTDDYFNIVTFSDIIEVWKVDHSIQATRQNVQSAKRYVNNMVASGWTDINGALRAAAKLFHGDRSPEPGGRAGGGDGNKVPLIIFLTDGEPTSGVTSTNTIVSNVKEAMGGSVSLFCLGFGDDVDFPFLQRLSLDNRGVARRIYEDADAHLQLTGFYDEVASPLLFDIQLDYLDDRVEDVTRTLFPAFFNGSELVVAGRLKGPSDGALRVRLQASGSAEALELENEIQLNGTEPGPACPQAGTRAGGFVQRLWAYHTIRELLQAQLKVDDAEGRRLLKEKATALSLKYNFVTPVTSMVVVKPGDGGEAATPAAAAPATSARSPSPTAGPAPSARSPIPSHAGQSASTPGKGASMPVALGTPTPPVPPGPPATETTPPAANVPLVHGPQPTKDAEDLLGATMLRSGELLVQPLPLLDYHDVKTDPQLDWDWPDVNTDEAHVSGFIAFDDSTSYFFSVDGDPHFVIRIPHSNETICFTVDGQADDTLRLVEDSVSGVTVDGHLEGAPVNPQHEGRPRNFFDRITVRVAGPGSGGYAVHVGREGVSLEEGKKRLAIPWEPHSVTRRPGLKLSVSRAAGASLWLGEKTGFLILLHRHAHPSPLQRDHLGFYVVQGDGLSPEARGMLGQFQHADIRLQRPSLAARRQGPDQAELRFGSHKLAVSLVTKTLKDSHLPAHEAACWLVHREDVEPLMGGPYLDYVVPRNRSA